MTTSLADNISFKFRNVQGEYGTKATDWSPAPEDINAAINNKVDDNQQAIFNRLFANGQQGFTLENNKVYINGEVIKANVISGSVIKAGTLDASKITTGTLSANVIKGSAISAINLSSESAVISSAKIANLDASKITSGTIAAARIDANTIVSKVNGASTTISGDKIRTGVLQANSGGSYLNLNNGSMLLGSKSASNYFEWTGSALNIKANAISIGTNSVATNNDVNNAVNNIQVGGRNYVLKSDAYITGNSDKQFDFSALQELRGKKITVSVEIDLNAATGSRVGFEPSIIYADGTTQYLGVWQSISSATTAKKRISATHTIQDKEIKSYSQRGIYIQGVSSGTARIGRPKLEIGTKATDWSPAPEDANDSITSLQNRVTTAESKITSNAIISTVQSTITNAKNEAINSANSSTDNKLKGYATTSSLTQTQNDIVAKFTSNGGYNLLKNSKGHNGTEFWLNNGGGIRVDADATFEQSFYTQAPSGIRYSKAIRLKNNTEYVYEGYVYSRNTISGSSAVPLHFWCNTTPSGSGQAQLSVLDYRQAVTTVNK